ncbi:MAG: transporter substrate-binding protein [Haloplasmataceae bacterium]|nr:transporter substrate-binding protein [Haloplasmataceae bacterium]
MAKPPTILNWIEGWLCYVKITILKNYLFTIIVFCTIFIIANTSFVKAEDDYTTVNTEIELEERYTEVSKNWVNIPNGNETIIITPKQFIHNLSIVNKANSNGYMSDVVEMTDESELKFNVEVQVTALYNITIDYYDFSDSILPQEGSIKINGEYPYYESRQLLFPLKWQPLSTEFKTDRYNNELLPKSKKVEEWLNTYVYDGSFLYSEPLKFKLNEGINEITIESKTGNLYIGNIEITSPNEKIDYNTYISQYVNEKTVEKIIPIDVEYIQSKSDAAVRLFSDTDPKSSRYDTRHKLLNAIEPSSWRKGGQSVTWKVSVEETGLYKLAFKYIQYTLVEMPVYRQIMIDGEIPFSELDNYPFHYTKKWKNETLQNNNEDFYFYLTEGTHDISLKVTLDPYRTIIEEVDVIMDEINELALKIKKLTGNKIDKYQNWKLTQYIPDVELLLSGWADHLDAQYIYGNSLNLSDNEAGELVNLKLASKQLRKLTDDPDQLPNHLNELSEGTSSVSQYLGAQMLRLLNQPLGLEQGYLYNGEDLPNPRANFFVRLWEGIKRFFLSFKPEGYSSTNSSADELEIWVNRPRQYVELMQKMIDEEFTPTTGIKVKLSIMPDENKLVLANAANTQPDIAMGVNHWLPYDLAIRGAALDLRQFDGYEELVAQYAKGAVIPYVFEDGVYAVPETQDFWVTMYRTDIFNVLNIPVPDTWEDVVNILPELQRQGMNFYEPIALYQGLKPFVATMPFIYQFGGNLYTEDGMGTAIDSEENVQAIKFMTDLFKIYNMPESVPNFYNHFRYGTLPIGIANTSTYIQLQVAAPEIKGNWDIALHPGIANEEGEIQRWAPVGGQAIVVFEGTKSAESSFDFIEWWMSTNTQSQFARDLQTMFGDSYLWNTANLAAFAQLPLPIEHKQVILEQWEWAMEASRVPGAYMVEREISNTWSKIVFNGSNVRTTIDDAVIKSNREILRKMEEFGYVKNGVVVKKYTVPTIYNIDYWLTEREE